MPLSTPPPTPTALPWGNAPVIDFDVTNFRVWALTDEMIQFWNISNHYGIANMFQILAIVALIFAFVQLLRGWLASLTTTGGNDAG